MTPPSSISSQYMPPGTSSSQRAEIVARTWAEVLDQASPDPGRSFFALGGDSLRGMQLCSRLSALLQLDIPADLIFEAPLLAEFTARLESLAPAARETERTDATPPMLSYSQERMYFMHELASGTAAYHVTMAWRLRGRLDTQAMAAAFDAVVACHEALRTTVISRDRELVPVIDAAPAPRLAQSNLSAGWDTAPQERLEDYLCEFANAPFQLDSGPLLRAVLIHQGTNNAVLAVVMHHLASDQWGLDVFFRDLATGYAAALAGGDQHRPDAVRMTGFAAARRTWFENTRLDVERRYWLQRLRGMAPAALTEDFVRPAQQSFAGAKLRLEFGLRDILALRAFGAAHGATLAMVMLAALKVLLMRHSGERDVAVGVPVANRQDPRSWDLMGSLVNTLVLRSELDPEMSFLSLLEEVRTRMREALCHQDMPFERLVRELNRERDPSRPALFTVMFNMLNTPLGAVSFPGLEWSRREFDKRSSQFDLTVTVDADHARSISFEYSTALFAPETIQRLAEQYIGLLHEALRDAGRPIGDVTLAPLEERRQLRDWSHGQRRPRTSATVDALMRGGLQQQTEACAITCGNERISHGELAAQSETLARGLAALGLGRGALVGLHLQRSIRMVAALLGVLRSGAAYVPMDPAYPAERLAFMAQDAAVRAVIVDEPAADAGRWPASCRLLTIDALLAAGRDAPAGLPIPAPHPADPAYVIYTSGSTGQPKGVVVPHGAVVNFLLSMRETPGLTAADRLLAVTTLSFDIAVLELLLPLSVGGCVVLATRAEQTDAEALRALLDRHGVTVMQATPSTWRLLIDSGWGGAMHLRALVGGETLGRELATELRLRCREVWNMYGPTETTVWSTCGKIGQQHRQRITLGRPITNTAVLVLDDRGEICPIGVPGEICIGGDGLALGYLNRPALTAERFIENRHSRDRRKSRLYRTGDRGRWLANGELEHLGRLDHQVKIRGHRIEPGEIESRLRQHGDITDALVLPLSRAGEQVLMAYVVTPQRAPAVRELREFLRAQLPDYMLPQHFVCLPALPLLPNGKVDRQSLLAMKVDLEQRGVAAPPRNPTEEAVWQIWRQVLHHDAFGVHDGLFDIGGHSLLAMQIVARIRGDLQRHCTLPMLLRHSTVASLAAALDGTEEGSAATIVPLQSLGTGPELFCLCGISLYRELADALAPEIPVCAVFVPEELGVFAGPAARGNPHPDVPMLARAYLETIRARQPQGPYRLLGFSFGGVIAFELAQQLRSRGHAVTLLTILDSDVPGPPVRSGLSLRQLRDRLKRLLQRLVPHWRGTTDSGAILDMDRYEAAMRGYQPRPYPGPALYVKSVENPSYDPGYSWDRLLLSGLTLPLADTHVGILKGDTVQRLAMELRQQLGPLSGNG